MKKRKSKAEEDDDFRLLMELAATVILGVFCGFCVVGFCILLSNLMGYFRW